MKSKADCYDMLIRALEHLVGTSSYSNFSILEYSLKKLISTDAAKQCLILALVLFGNLSVFGTQYVHVENFDQKINKFYHKILLLLQDAMNMHRENTPEYISVAHRTISTSTTPTDIFKFVERLLHNAKIDSTLAWFVVTKDHHDLSKVEIKPFSYFRQEQLQTVSRTMSHVPPPPGFPP
ncbi:MAG: hypothetical protein MJE68_07010, partial [Proteobacteria bacterium]|nr:hypothetical protein [Pseudomonadota bacterium]